MPGQETKKTKRFSTRTILREIENQPLENILEIKDPKQVAAYFKEAYKVMAEVSTWVEDGKKGLIWDATLVFGNIVDDTIQLLPAKNMPLKVSQIVNSSVNLLGQFFFNRVKLGRANLLFKAKLMSATSAELIFEFPRRVFKQQRRKELRLNFREDQYFIVEIEHPLYGDGFIKKRILDISPTGLSFLAEPDDLVLFQKGSICDGQARQINDHGLKV